MEKVMVIGCPGSGKSTFSRELHRITGLPLFYLDMLYHQSDRTISTKEEFDRQLAQILDQQQWIMDGNYGRTMSKRLTHCDTVFWLDYPLEICLQGLESRFGKPREDMPWVELEWDEEFLEFVKNFPAVNRPEIQALIETYGKDKEVIVFHSRDMAARFLEQLR